MQSRAVECCKHRVPGLLALLAILFSGVGLVRALGPTHGTIEGNTYVDARFGMRYTFPSSLEVQTSLNGMPVGTGQKRDGSEFLLSAMEKPNGQVRSGVFLTADPVGALGVNDVDQFMRLLIAKSPTFKGHVDIRPVTVAGRAFYRANSGGDSPVRFYGAQMGTACGGQFLIFWFSGATAAKVDELVHTLDGMTLTCPAATH